MLLILTMLTLVLQRRLTSVAGAAFTQAHFQCPARGLTQFRQQCRASPQSNFQRRVATGSAMADFKVFVINDQARLVLSQGDLTKWDGDVIVNAGAWRAASLRLRHSVSKATQPSQ